jgi:secreted trypsin-like serine protease
VTRRGWRAPGVILAFVTATLLPSGAQAIVGGQAVKPGALPSLAKVLDYFHPGLVAECTGTVVAPRLVLTAGHCAENAGTGVLDTAAHFRVVTGNVDWTASPRQELRVSQIVPYPRYERVGPLQGSGDVALLVLRQRTNAPAIRLATSADSTLWQAGVHALIAGWGDRHGGATVRPTRLQSAPTVLQSPQWCVEHGLDFHPSGQLCSIDPPRYATGGCNGDSGGPLIVDAATRGGIEVGILRAVVEPSGVQPVCPTTEPTVYTRSETIASWVSEWATRLRTG